MAVVPWEETGVVAPGKTHTYIWEVAGALPVRGPNDPSSVVWLYHSHVVEARDVNSGLGRSDHRSRDAAWRAPDGTPKDVDREFVSLLHGLQ